MAVRPGGKPDGDREMKMKITKSQLVKIIKEEIDSISEEKWEATGNRYSRAGIPGSKAGHNRAKVPGSKAGHNRASIPGHSGKPSDIERLRKKLAALRSGGVEEAYGPSDSDYGYYPSSHPLAGLPYLETTPEEAYEFYAITLKKIANAMGEDMTFEDALAAIEASRESGKGLDVPSLEENMGDYYDPRQPGGHHDQPKTTNKQLARQCKEGDQKACEMLEKRLGKK